MIDGNLSQGPLQGPHHESHDYKESLLDPSEQAELNTLRDEQMASSPDSKWTETKRLRFLELSNKAEAVLAARMKQYGNK